jgi:hypothetical protein
MCSLRAINALLGERTLGIPLFCLGIVIEVKREMSDSSFDTITDSYAAQCTDYQNVSIRLGYLLVLDLVASNSEGTTPR